MKIVQQMSWSKTSVIVTLFVILLMIGIAVFSPRIDDGLTIASIIVLATLILICAAAMCFMPMKIVLDSESLTVMFPCRYKSLPIKEISEATPYTDPKRLIRICGSGAFFGWWGWYSAKGEGKFMMYASTLDHLLMIKLKNGKKYVISCSNPQAIANAIESTH